MFAVSGLAVVLLVVALSVCVSLQPELSDTLWDCGTDSPEENEKEVMPNALDLKRINHFSSKISRSSCGISQIIAGNQRIF